MKSNQLLFLLFPIALASCDAQESKSTPGQTPAKNQQQAPSPRIDALFTFSKDVQKAADSLNGLSNHTPDSLYRAQLHSSSRNWVALMNDLTALLRLEELLATTERSQAQRDIVATHYYLVYMTVFSRRHDLAALRKLNPQGEKSWEDIQKTIDSTEIFLRNSSSELAPTITEKLDTETAEFRKIVTETPGDLDALQKILNK